MKTKFVVCLALGTMATFSASAISITSAGSFYTQDFDSLATTGASVAWANDATLPGWHLFRQPSPGTALTTYAAGAGTSTAGGFYSFGAAGSSDRALGGLGSRGAYFGSPATSAVAGWIAVSFENKSGGAFTGFSATWNGEQWRNGGNTTAQTMVFQYGLGTTFVEVTDWITPGGNFDWTSPVASATAAAVNGNTDGLVSGVGGVIDGLTWLPGETLWLRWVEVNDDGNDHGLAIDDFAFRASAPSGAVPDTGTTVWLLALPLIVLGLVRHRRLCGA